MTDYQNIESNCPYAKESNSIEQFMQYNAWCEGADWAYKHPNWHKYPDEKPSGYNDALPKYFICVVEYRLHGSHPKSIEKACYVQKTDSWHFFENEPAMEYSSVLYWLEEPPMPEE